MRSLLVLVLIVFALVSAANAQFSTKEVEEKVYCPCGCGEVLADCQCEDAVRERAKISRMMAEGKTPEEIVEEYARLYGNSAVVRQVESVEEDSRQVSMLPLYLLGIAVTAAVAYGFGRSGRGGKGRDGKDWDFK
ncbi:MAG: hypothetical protein GXO67_02850 [Archaeoglobi archaeon]|nr:hypothetical protein [Archaeoglobi archaeon]